MSDEHAWLPLFALVPGYPDALRQLFQAIPKALAVIGVGGLASEGTENMLMAYFSAAFEI